MKGWWLKRQFRVAIASALIDRAAADVEMVHDDLARTGTKHPFVAQVTLDRMGAVRRELRAIAEELSEIV